MRISGSDYPAGNIELAFNRLFKISVGQRGTDWDADTFSNGTPAQLGKVLVKAADEIEINFGNLTFSEEDNQNGGHQTILNLAVSQIRDLGHRLEKEPKANAEANDYHWIIIGKLIEIITVLLDRASQP